MFSHSKPEVQTTNWCFPFSITLSCLSKSEVKFRISLQIISTCYTACILIRQSSPSCKRSQEPHLTLIKHAINWRTVNRLPLPCPRGSHFFPTYSGPLHTLESNVMYDKRNVLVIFWVVRPHGLANGGSMSFRNVGTHLQENTQHRAPTPISAQPRETLISNKKRPSEQNS